MIGCMSHFGGPVKVAVEIPKECFDEKDYLNHRYHSKRLLYLSHILTSLKKKGVCKKFGIAEIKWAKACKDMRKPTLIGTFEDHNLQFEISTCIPVDTFPLAKLSPDRNNIRSVKDCSKAGSDGTASLLPTPMYNGGIVEDMLSLVEVDELKTVSTRFEKMGDVTTLLMAWAHQNGLLEGNDGLNEALFLEIVKMVLSEDQIYTVQRMHLFRGALLVIANESKFTKKGVFMESKPLVGINCSPPTHSVWRRSGSPVTLIDKTGWKNVTRGISSECWAQARMCAKATAKILAEMPGPDAIDSVFMRCSNISMLFDVWCNCEVQIEDLDPCISDQGSWLSLEEHVKQVATRAMGDRATLVRVLHSAYISDVQDGKTLRAISQEHDLIRLCCRLDSSKASRSVDVGPAADNPMAKDFRQFWGEKSELRRFQDGKICESIIWSTTESNKHRIVGDILNYSLERHAGVIKVDIPAMSLTAGLARSEISPQEEIINERNCSEGATRLGKMLKSLDEVTLGVVNTQPVSDVLRSTSVFPPFMHELAGAVSHPERSNLIPRCLKPIEILCQLEGSGKWPDAPAAYQKMKAAVGVQLAHALKSSYGTEAIASEHCIDVLFEGFAYRLLLFSERDLLALQKKSASVGWATIPPEKDIPLRQSHQGLISSLVGAHPSFKTCCRLAKLWVARQYLGNHICEEAVELLCAAAYTTKVNIGGSCPNAPELGFLSFLDIIANHPWEIQPLVLDRKIAEEAVRLMLRLQAVGKAPAMFIVVGGNTCDSLNCVGWTQSSPSKVILFRARTLAKKAIRIIQARMLGCSLETESLPSQVFGHSLKDYDVVIHLRQDALQNLVNQNQYDNSVDSVVDFVEVMADLGADELKHCKAILSGIPRSLLQQKGARAIRKDLLIGFDPVLMFAKVLTGKYGQIAVVCLDVLCGEKIGLKVKPKFLRPIEYHADYGSSVFAPVPGNKVVVDLHALAQDIIDLGPGLVDHVQFLPPT